MRRILPLFLIAFIIPLSLSAQGDFRPGYVVKNNGDSVAGFVDYRSAKKSAQTCFFRETSRGETLRYTPAEIAAYGFRDDKRYETKTVSIDSAKEVTVFIENLVKGPMSLYRYRSIFYVETDKLIKLPVKADKIVNTDRGQFSKSDYRYVGMLNHLMYDCGLRADEIKYEERGITNLVQNYNRCKGGAGVVFKQKKPWTSVMFQVFGGIDLSDLSVDGMDAEAFKQNRSPLIGAGFDISSPRINDKIFFTLEASYLKKQYQGYAEVRNAAIDRTDYFIPITFLKVPVGIRYNFLTEAQTPYIRIGLSQYFKLKSSLEVLNEHQNHDVVTTTFNTYDLDSRNQTGFWVGAGFSKIIRSRIKAFGEIRYERTNGFIGKPFVNSSSSTQNITILAGLRF